MKLTLDNLNSHLQRIEYTLRGKVPNRFIINNKGENTGIRVWDETIEFNMEHCGLKAVAVMGKCTIKMLSKTTVMFGDGKLFIQLHNFEKRKHGN